MKKFLYRGFRLVLMCAVMALTPCILYAVPAHPGVGTVRQPDGVEVNVYLRGDERLNWYEDKNGYTIIHDTASKSWVYANRNANGNLVPTLLRAGRDDPSKTLIKGLRQTACSVEKVKYYNSEAIVQKVSAKGELCNLVILVEFPDLHFKYKSSDFDKLFNEVGYSNEGANGSVKDYFNEVSGGKVNLRSIVVGPFTSSRNYAYYGEEANNSWAVQDMVTDVLEQLENKGFDFSQCDMDGDGEIDGLDIIHAGYGAEYSGNSRNYIWSHKSNMRTPIRYDGVRIYNYHTESELYGRESDPQGNRITPIGVICHETGHFWGLPDLYDISDSPDKGAGVGEFCLMGSGSWNGNGNTPAHMSAWCKVFLGWISPIQMIKNGTYSIEDVVEKMEIYKIPKTTYEYFLIENRWGSGYDSELPGDNRGLLIWHVDELQTSNSDRFHYKVDLEEASGIQHLEQSDYNRGDDSDYFRAGNATDFSSKTTPNNCWYNGDTPSWSISSISASSSVMTFVISGMNERPYNDNFADATLLSGESGSIEGLNAGATFESGEPEHKYSSATTSVWWKWTPTKSGSVTFSTEGSSFDTILAVYTGSTLSSLTQYALDDDGGTDNTSICTFEAVAGTTYYIAVAGYDAKTGAIKLSWEQIVKVLPDLIFSYHYLDEWTTEVFLSNLVTGKEPVTTFDYGEKIYLFCGFRNDGEHILEDDFNIRHELIDGNGCVISTWNYTETDTIPIGKMRKWEGAEWGAFDNLSPGTYTYRCTLDERNDIEEINEFDNVREYEFTVQAPLPVFTIENGVLTGVELNGATEVVIPSKINGISVKTIGAAFEDCVSLEKVVMPEGVLSIGRYAFYGCTSLKCVVIPNSVTSIGSEAFCRCTSLGSVSIPNGVTYIGPRAFFQCDSLSSVVIPDSVTEIENETFRGCGLLGDVTIGNGVTNIEDYAFYYCGSVTNINIGGKIKRIGLSAFDHAMETSYEYDGNLSVRISDLINWCNINFAGEKSNPLHEGANLYLNNELVSDLVIPDGTKKIGSYAFCGCVSLASVSIPDTVNSIWNAFRNCNNLTYAWVPISLREQVENNYTFSGCSDDLQIEYYSGSHVITFNANGGVVSQESLTVEYGGAIGELPTPTRDGYTFLGWFTAAEGGEQVTPDTVVTGDMTLYAQWGLVESLTVSASLVVADDSGKSGLISITANCDWSVSTSDSWITVSPTSGSGSGTISYTIAANTTSQSRPGTITVTSSGGITRTIAVSQEGLPMYEVAFNPNGGTLSGGATRNIVSGAEIGTLPTPTRDGYTFLGWFTAANGGEKVTESTVVTGDMTLYAQWEEELKEPSFEIDENGVLSSVELNGATEIIIPSNVKVIAEEAFSGCCDLTSVTIPEGVVSIGYDAFNCCCALTSINIPSTVTNIGDNAFGNCTNLRIVTGGEGLKRVGYDAFYETLFLYGEDSWEDIEVNEDYANGYGLNLVQLGNFIVGRRGSLAEAENDEYYDEEGNWIWEYNLIISEGTTGIADGLFADLPITSVTIPGSIKRIPENVFQNCSYLKNLTINEGVEEIGEYAFSYAGCYSGEDVITTLVVPSSVAKIGEYAFADFGYLKYVVGLDDTDDVSMDAFIWTPYVDGWQAPVLNIEDGVVYGLGWATRFDDGCITNNVLYIPEGVTNVADCAFQGMDEFSKVVLPSSLRSIGYEAFYDCEELREIEGDVNLESVGYDAFYDTLFLFGEDSWEDVEANEDYVNGYGLDLVQLGNFIVGIRGSLEEAWNDEYYDEDGNWTWEYNLVIPEGVTGIADSLFEDLPITSVTIPGSIKRIPENAFNSCCYLKNLTINEGVEEIGDYAFQRAGSYLEEDGITTLTIPSSVTKIGEYGFASLGCLKYVVGLDDADDVHSDAFYGTPYADGWEAPVLIIEDGVVYGLDRETRFDDGCITNNVLYIPEGVTNIADCAFKEMYEFSKAVLPSSLRSIGHEAFYDCEELREVEGGVNLERVGYNVFNETLFLYKADSWEDVESNGDYLNDYGLDLVCLGNFIVGRRGSLAEAEKDEYYDDEGNWIWKYELVIPEGVTGLADELFNNLPITSVTIPNSIVSIPDYTFTYTELESVVIPENIVSIGEEAFASCANLKYAKVPLALKSQVEEGNVFAYCSPDLQIEYYDNASLVAPVITPGDGTEFYEDSCTVTITCETEGSTIYYTTDGTTPRPRPANLYTEPFEIADTTTVKAIAVKGEERTDLVSATIVKKEIVLAAPVITPTDGTEFYEDSCMVTISCATEGASIYYIVCDTNNVTNPRPSDRNLYTEPFMVSATKMVRAFSMFGSKTSDIVSSTLIKRELTLPVAVDAPELTFTTGGDAKWTPEFNGSAKVGGSLAQSGALSWSEADCDPFETWMETTVAGVGTFSFWWKVDCEDDPWGATWDRFEVYTNGVEAARIDGKTEWEKIEFTFADSRTHTVRWRFCKDDWDDEKLTDLAWVDGVVWTPASTDITVDVGGGKNVVVPVSWIDKYDSIVTAVGGDKVAALKLTAANGRKVWECFMLGIDPTKADDDFKITRFWMENGKPMFEFSHSVDGAGNSFAPRIKTKGKAKLSDSWSDVPTGGDSSFRFFTVEVMLP